jgi:hypothetical protein
MPETKIIVIGVTVALVIGAALYYFLVMRKSVSDTSDDKGTVISKTTDAEGNVVTVYAKTDGDVVTINTDAVGKIISSVTTESDNVVDPLNIVVVDPPNILEVGTGITSSAKSTENGFSITVSGKPTLTIDPIKGFSIYGFVKQPSMGKYNSYNWIFTLGQKLNTDQARMQYNYNGINIRIKNTSDKYVNILPTVFAKFGPWVHLVWTYKNGINTFYRDGEKFDGKTENMSFSNITNFSFPNNKKATSAKWKITDHVLTLAEIQADKDLPPS